MKLRYWVFLLICFAIAGCSPKPQNGKAPESEGLKPESAHHAGDSASASNAGLRFKIGRASCRERVLTDV